MPKSPTSRTKRPKSPTSRINIRRTIFLHGDLARFTARFTCEATSPAEAISALASQFDGFAAALRHRHWLVLAGSRRHGRALGGTGLHAPFAARHLHLLPAAMGRGRDEGKMLLGLTLLGLSFVPGVQAGLTSSMTQLGTAVGGATGGELGGFFASRLLGGAAGWLLHAGAGEALAPQLRQPAGQADSSAIQVSPPVGEGAAIPLIYGRVRVHDAPLIASGLTVEVTNL